MKSAAIFVGAASAVATDVSPFSVAHAARSEARLKQSVTSGYFSFTFTGDGCGGQCPTSGCYQEDLNCESCLESWHSFPPDASYKYAAIVSHGCGGTKVECDECQGMMGLSRYSVATDVNPFAVAHAALSEARLKPSVTSGYFSFTFTGDGCGGQCPTSGCYQEDLNCESCLESWHSFPPDASYKYAAIVSHGCAGTKLDCDECQGMMGLSRYSVAADVNPFAVAQAALSEARLKQSVTSGYFSFTFTGDGCGGQCPTSGCYQEDLNCESCLESWHSFPPDATYKYAAIVSHGCAGTKVECDECQGMMGLSRYSVATNVNPFAVAQAALSEARLKPSVTSGYFSFTFTGDGCGGQCPTSGCYQEDLNCESCLESWHSFPPDASYKYAAIASHGCAGTKVDCDECQGMMGLSRYSLESSSPTIV